MRVIKKEFKVEIFSDEGHKYGGLFSDLLPMPFGPKDLGIDVLKES